MDLFEIGVHEGIISFNEDNSRITYNYQKKSRNYNNPEEKVQAETFLKLVFTFSYPEKRIRQFVPVTMGSETKEADIIVYDDDECTKPIIVVECKESGVSEQEFQQAINQAASYAYALSGTIKCIWVTSKIKDACFLINKENQTKNSIPSIPPFGREIPKYKYAKGGLVQGEVAGDNKIKQQFFELEEIEESELTNRFKQAHQSLWAGGELNPSEAFDELDKLIFCKIWDERKKTRKIGEPYDFQIIDIERPKNATQEQVSALEDKITQELYKRIIALYEEGRTKDREVFKDNIRLSPEKVRMVVGYLEGINLSKTDLDSKGKAFETFMGSYFRGDFGQYFTPRPIVKFIVEALPITEELKVLDTSCGSGGFLLYALDKVRRRADEFIPYDKNGNEPIEHWQFWHDFASTKLFGIEINEQIARTAKMNMIIHDDGHTNVISSDGLLPAHDIMLNTDNKGFEENSFDFIITNPPFGSAVKQTEKSYLHQYKFGNKDVSWLDTKNSAVQNRDTQNTEVLFIEQDYNFLKEGGFLAIVIPDGILTNSTMQYVRDNIEEWYRIVAVVSMPQTAFTATGAGVKSSVLFLRKWNAEQTEKIRSKKLTIQERLKKEADYLKKVTDWETEKKQIIKNHTGFAYIGEETDKKKIEKTSEFAEWKKEISENYAQKIKDLQEDLEEKYLAAKQTELDDYDIFMAIAEDIGYDATGKETGVNELEEIGTELSKFINQIVESE